MSVCVYIHVWRIESEYVCKCMLCVYILEYPKQDDWMEVWHLAASSKWNEKSLFA